MASKSKIQNLKSKIAGTLIFLATRSSPAVAFMAGLKPVPTSAGSCQRPSPSDSSGTIRFEDITQKAGINFIHYTGAFGKKYLAGNHGTRLRVH